MFSRTRLILRIFPQLYRSTCMCRPRAFASDANDKNTHFGFDEVSKEEKGQRVYHVFENVAEKYDVMNDVMSGGIHRLWKDYFMRCLAPGPSTKLLDVAGGTGDIAFRFLQYVQSEQTVETADDTTTHVTVCDINKAMLDVGRKRAKQVGFTQGISWVQGNAESLPFESNTFDAVTIAFGIRNVTHIDQALAEAYRVLRRGGRFLCLEFSQVQNPVLEKLYHEYSFQVIPVMGQLVAGDWKSYQYLVESIRQFPPQEEFADKMKAAGFSAVIFENLLFGVSAIHSGFKLSQTCNS